MEEVRELDRILRECTGEKPPPCTATCPSHVDVLGFITRLKEGNYSDALALFKESNPFPATCGRVCHHPCEGICTRSDVDQPVAIAHLHRFLADLDLSGQNRYVPETKEKKQEKVAVIGAGPAGLSAAYYLAKEGYPVTVFEKLPIPGGMMAVGIPDYRLPKEILDGEIQVIRDMGVKIETGVDIGNDVTMKQLRKEGYRAFFIGIGAQECKRLGLAGEDLDGVYSGIDFLREVNLGNSVSLGDRVAVIGGGNVAMDAVRTALRTGSKAPFIIYRRSLEEMPVNEEEIEECREEGIEIHMLTAPARIIGENGRVKAIECLKMALGEPDESGRRRPLPVKGSEYIIEVDSIIPAIGQESEWACLGEDCACTLSEWGTMNVDPITFQTDEPDIFAGGDAVTGPKTVVEAIEAGKQAAMSIDRFLRGEDPKEGRERNWDYLKPDTSREGPMPRTVMRKISVNEREGNFKEVALGLSEDEATAEADRCLTCECKICVEHCEFLRMYCTSPRELAKKWEQSEIRHDPKIAYSCTLCDLCVRYCPAELRISKMCMEMREQLVKEGLGPLKGHAFVRKNQDFALSDEFALALPDPEQEKCRRVFFPGCSLPAYSPALTLKTFHHLRKRLPGTGIVLGCCGKQTLCLGDREKFEEVLEKTRGLIKKLGVSEAIVACPECYETLKEYGPELKLTFLSEAILEVGLPDDIKKVGGRTLSLHDSCATRSEKEIHDSVRALVRKMGYHVEEMAYTRENTRCCGMGGMVAFANPKLTGRMTKSRAKEASHDILTYCASCREALGAHKSAVHILDLIFNPDGENLKDEPPKSGKVRRENQASLKSTIEKELSIHDA